MRVVPNEPSTSPDSPARSFAPGAPESPGPLPEELSELLDRGEALIWWNEKTKIDWIAPAVTFVVCMLLMGAITMLAPTFWARSPFEYWGPIAAMVLPAAFLLWREYFGRGTWMVTQRRIVAIDHRGHAQGLAFRSIREVRRDHWSGGVRLVGKEKALRVAPSFCKDLRVSMQTQLRNKVLGSGDRAPQDHVGGWFPRS